MAQEKTSTLKEKRLPTIISARTGLVSADDAIMRHLPPNYLERTVGEALDYLLKHNSLKDDEVSLAKSIRKEMKAEDFVVVINGKNAGLAEKIADYAVKKQHELSNKQARQYLALEIEVSAVQAGGFY